MTPFFCSGQIGHYAENQYWSQITAPQLGMVNGKGNDNILVCTLFVSTMVDTLGRKGKNVCPCSSDRAVKFDTGSGILAQKNSFAPVVGPHQHCKVQLPSFW